MSIRAGILGSTGYTGSQLVSLLINHGSVDIAWLTSEKFKDMPYTESFPFLRGLIDKQCVSITRLEQQESVDIIFSCLPDGTSVHFIKKLHNSGTKIIDLSPDLRIKDLKTFKKLFNTDHQAPGLAEEAVYGLPELNRENIKNSNLVSNPGCFATSVLLSVAPVIENGIKIRNMVADVKAPISGAGRAPRLEYHFPEINQNIQSESFGTHFQKVEVEDFLRSRFGVKQRLVFRTHRIPVKRGILSTIYMDIGKKYSYEEIFSLFKNYYQGEEFVRVRDNGDTMQLKNVLNSNFCDINFDLQDGQLIVETVIDNIIKGASGQALQNMNIMFGMPENTGLNTVPSYP